MDGCRGHEILGEDWGFWSGKYMEIIIFCFIKDYNLSL